jgi:hypothetical protein
VVAAHEGRRTAALGLPRAGMPEAQDEAEEIDVLLLRLTERHATVGENTQAATPAGGAA